MKKYSTVYEYKAPHTLGVLYFLACCSALSVFTMEGKENAVGTFLRLQQEEAERKLAIAKDNLASAKSSREAAKSKRNKAFQTYNEKKAQSSQQEVQQFYKTLWEEAQQEVCEVQQEVCEAQQEVKRASKMLDIAVDQVQRANEIAQADHKKKQSAGLF